jgi:uncharacterized LabA/DUF88 family protein
MRTIVYVDGFNLYYGALRGTPYRWLDVAALCQILLPRHDVVAIRYYTAKVGRGAEGTDQAIRQHLYLRALKTNPLVETHYGHFLQHTVTLPLARAVSGGPRFVSVIRTEEKGSDVNLATHMVRDAYESDDHAAILISNDSDLAAPLELLRTRLKRTVGVLNPHPKQSVVLRRTATFTKQIRSGALKASQFPDELADASGVFRKPRTW